MEKRKGILLAVIEEDYFEEKIAELKSLCSTINIDISHVFTQSVSQRKIGLLGKGKIQEIVDMDLSYDVVVTYQSCTPLDIRVLKEAFGVEILDKMRVVLSIFSMRAQSKLSKLEIQLASLYNERDELVGSYESFSRQAGSSGSVSSRGSGEQQLQVDRRRINQKIGKLKRDIINEKQKQEISKKRQKESGVFSVALVGYTNAGKSTLVNSLLHLSNPTRDDKQVVSENQVFSSLDTTTRRVDIDGYPPFIIIDTVGFIIDLPSNLIASFYSTLSNIEDADCVIELLDGSYDLSIQIDSIREYTEKIDPFKRITIINKKDLIEKNNTPYPAISAKTHEGIDVLLKKIETIKLHDFTLKEGYVHPTHVHEFYQHPDDVFVKAHVEKDSDVWMSVYVNDKTKELVRYIKDDEKDCISFH